MLLDDAVAQHLIPTSPGRQNRRRGRRRDHAPTKAEKVFAMPEHVLHTYCGSPSTRLSSAGHQPDYWSSPPRDRPGPPARASPGKSAVEVYSHVAPEIERHLLDTLEQRCRHARRTRRPKDTRPRNRRSRKHAHHTTPAQRTIAPTRQKSSTPQLTGEQATKRSSTQDTNALQNYSSHAQRHDHDSYGRMIVGCMKRPSDQAINLIRRA
jgi:hypothetical protein